MIDSRSVVCKRCGGPTGLADVVVQHSRFDPLVVAECAACGAIADIGPHQW